MSLLPVPSTHPLQWGRRLASHSRFGARPPQLRLQPRGKGYAGATLTTLHPARGRPSLSAAQTR